MEFKLKGVMPAIITPVTKEGKLNVNELERLIEHLIAEGADGFYVGGATGEGLVIEKEMHKQLTTEAVRIVAKRVPVIVHVARIVYSEMIELAKHAQSVGADAISAVPPFFYAYNEQAIFDYYNGLCASTALPTIIYNNPNAGVTFSVSLLKRLFAIENLTGIKWTNADFYPIMQILPDYPNIEVINGPDQLLLCGLSAGCHSAIGTTYNFQLPTIKKIYDAFMRGDMETARLEQQKANKVIAVAQKKDTLIATKNILSFQGFDVAYPLFPKRDFTAEEKEQLKADLREAGFDI